MTLHKKILASLAFSTVLSLTAQTNEMVIQTNKPGATIQPTMYGLFFEDINYAADGGLYAEMIKNRSFEFPQNFMGWEVFGNVELKNDGPFERNPHYIRMGHSGHQHKRSGLQNEGFFGVAFNKDSEYRFSVWARVPDGEKATFAVELIDPKSMGESQQIAKADITVDSNEWKKYKVILKPGKTEAKGKLRIV